jgi:sodium-dependent phosphate cotransporter
MAARSRRFNVVHVATAPVVHGVTGATAHLSTTLGPLFTIVIGAVLILAAVRYLGKLLSCSWSAKPATS